MPSYPEKIKVALCAKEKLVLTINNPTDEVVFSLKQSSWDSLIKESSLRFLSIPNTGPVDFSPVCLGHCPGLLFSGVG